METGQTMVAAGVGTYRGKSAFAIGQPCFGQWTDRIQAGGYLWLKRVCGRPMPVSACSSRIKKGAPLRGRPDF
ncbi:YadA-like family protein [Sphingomonas xanthus]